MQINFLKIQQKSRENGLVIFSKSNFSIWRENFIVFKSQNNSWKDFILQKSKHWLFLKFNKTHQKFNFWTQIGLLLQFVEQEKKKFRRARSGKMAPCKILRLKMAFLCSTIFMWWYYYSTQRVDNEMVC